VVALGLAKALVGAAVADAVGAAACGLQLVHAAATSSNAVAEISGAERGRQDRIPGRMGWIVFAT
jgi:hypothetical protein